MKPYTVPFKMFGLHRSCTNLVRRLVMDHFDTLSCEQVGPWKHTAIDAEILQRKIAGRPVRLIVCVRHPLAWLPAMRRYFERHKNADGTVCPQYQRGWSLERFCRSRHYGYANPVDRWNALNRHYLDVIDAHPDLGIVVRSEDLMGREDQQTQIRRIEQRLGLVPTTRFRAIVNRVDNMSRVGQEKMDFDYYRRCDYLDQYTPELLAWVIDRLDKRLMNRLEYEYDIHSEHESKTPTATSAQAIA